MSVKPALILIAELGQNGQGSVEVYRDLIRICARPARHDLYGPSVGGVDAVKMTKRALRHELTTDADRVPYAGDHAFASTYGEHRAKLELTDVEHAECYRYAKECGLDFVETVCAPEALSILDHFTPDSLKVASRDLTNHRLLGALADTRIPLIISTGMADKRDLDDALEVITRHHDDITILHCVSTYPTAPVDANLLTIPWLKEHYPFRIGYSDHANGMWAAISAVTLGAELVEKHVTLNRQMRGTDHEGSLDPGGVYMWVRDSRQAELGRGEYDMVRAESSEPARVKLARSVATSRPIPAGWKITESDLRPLSPGSGIPWPERSGLLGRTTIHRLPEAHLLTATMVA